MRGFNRSLAVFALLLFATAICLLAGAAPNEMQYAPVAAQSVVTQPAADVSAAREAKQDDATPVAPISMADADGQGLILEELDARAAVQGMLSLTELELRFRNPKSKRIEGRFSCVLPQNAAISRFAKEVNGQLMEGEVVERLRANQVYDQFLHQMRDPALLEQDQGNRFSARIFPIEANATVRIVLSYSALLPVEQGVRRYTLPLRGMAKVDHLTFRAFVSALPGEEGPGSGKSNVSGLANASHSTADVISVDEHDYTPRHDIQLAWQPAADAPASRLLRAGEFYVAAFRPSFGAPREAAAGSRSWALYVDTSASSAEGAEHRIRALEMLLGALPAGDSVQLLAFDQEVVTLGSGSAAEIGRNAGSLLRARLFLGGTDLGGLLQHIAKSARSDPSRTIVVASDLVATLGNAERKDVVAAIDAIPHATTVHALILGSRQDAAIARALTAGRGRIVTIPFSESMAQRAREAAAALRRPRGASFDVTDSGAQWLYPQHFDDVRSGDEIVVLGRRKPAGDPSPRLNGVAAQSLSATTLDTGTFAPLLQREAYRAYLDYLGEREATEPSDAVRSALATEQVRISIEQRVVIPRTTMLVLETEWDYQRFGLDRRALADILTIDAGGIGIIDRSKGKDVVVRQPIPVSPMDVRKSARMLPPRPADPTGLSDEVPGGVIDSSPAAEAMPAMPLAESMSVSATPPAEAQSAGAGNGAGWAYMDTRSQRAGVTPPAQLTPDTSNAPGPVPALAPHTERGRGRVVEKKQDDDWTHPRRPTRDEVSELQEKLDDDPHDRDAYNRVSAALAAREEWDALRRLALRWQPFDPENPQVYELLGLADEHLGNESEAARADASIIELAPAKPELLQRAGLLLLRTHHANLAETPLRRALELRPDRVNSYRHLALMLWLEGRPDEAAQVLEAATRQHFPQWYGNAQRVVREELGYVYRSLLAKQPLRRAEIEQRSHDFDVDLTRRDALRVTLAWETDANDVDLHVVDPAGEECFYSHKETAAGLELYEDITQGFGPEVVRTSKLRNGTYHIGVNYFAAGPMGVSRGIVVVMRGDDVQIYPFRLVEDSHGGNIAQLATVTVEG